MTLPSLPEIEAAAARIAGQVLLTPVLPLSSDRWRGVLPAGMRGTLKLELFQQSGSFKARGALLGIDALTASERRAGVVAASGGNHALAVGWAARAAGVDALIAMPRATDPARIEAVEDTGARVILCDDMAAAFAVMEDEAARGRTLMHPFEGAHMTLGAATLGVEFARQAPEAEVFVIPVGGGGLIGGMAAGIKAVRPGARVIGVEPVGADSLTRSLAAGRPVTLDRIDTIADSLGAPKALPMSFAAAQATVDDMVHVTDDALRMGMRIYQDVLRLTAEPACAASLAAAIGPLAGELAGRAVGLIACESNIGMDRWRGLTA